MTEIIESNNMQVCNECDRHCPMDALRCGRGKRAAGQLTERSDSPSGDRHEHGGHEERGGRHEHGGREEHGDRHERGGREGHGGRHERGGHEEHGDRHERGERKEHGDRHERGGREEHGDRAGHHGHIHEFNTNAEGSKGLYARLRQCGHYLFHNGKDYSSQKKVLSLISEHGGEITQRELTGELGIHRASVSELLGKLEKKGFITRRQDDEDRRRVQISLTEEGTLSLQENSRAQSGQDLDKMFAILSEEEKNSLYTILGKLIGAWGDAQSHGKREKS